MILQNCGLLYGYHVACDFGIPYMLHNSKHDNLDLKVCKSSTPIFLERQYDLHNCMVTFDKNMSIWRQDDEIIMLTKDMGTYKMNNSSVCFNGDINSCLPWIVLSNTLFIKKAYMMHYLCLHALVLEKHNSSIAIIGYSGDGKSTIGSRLLCNGYKLISDDLLVINFIDKIPYACSGLSFMKIWRGNCLLDIFNIKDINELDIMPGQGIGKLIIDVHEIGLYCTQPLIKLRKVYILQPCEIKNCIIEKLNQRDTFLILFDMLQGKYFIDNYALISNQINKLINNEDIDFKRLKFKKEKTQLDNIIQSIMEDNINEAIV